MAGVVNELPRQNASAHSPACAVADAGQFPFNFLCRRAGDDQHNVFTRPMPSTNTPTGGSEDEPQIIPAGRTLTFEVGYVQGNAGPQKTNDDAGDPNPARVWTFTTIDINNSAWGGWGPVSNSGSTSQPCPGADGSPILYAVSESPYFGGVEHAVNCQSEGKMVVWPDRVQPGTFNERKYTFSFTINPNFKPDSGTFSVDNPYLICIRTNVAVAPQGMFWGAANNFAALRRIAKKSEKNDCYGIVPADITVTARSSAPGDEDESVTGHVGTGRTLDGVRVLRSRQCSGAPTDYDAKFTGSSGPGKLLFGESGGRFFCLRVDPAYYIVTVGGTRYQLRQPIHNYDIDQNSFENQVAWAFCHDRDNPDINGWDTDCWGREQYDMPTDDYEFIYDPMPDPPETNKWDTYGRNLSPLQTASSPTCSANMDNSVCRVDYTMTIENNHDANYENTFIHDNIPLNLQQLENGGTFKPVIDSVSLYKAWGPPGWSVVPASSASTVFLNAPGCGPVNPCTGFGASLPYWYGGLPDPEWLSVYYIQPTPSTPGHITVHAPVMPAYTRLVIQWHGYVKATEHIGVYPKDPNPAAPRGYCKNSGAGSYTAIGLLDWCEDRTPGGDGLQGVVNSAHTTVDGAITDQWSPWWQAYRPIPGDISCVGKSAPNAAYEVENPIITSAVGCGLQTATDSSGNPVKQIFSNAQYNNFQFHINVLGQTAGSPHWGPAYYELFDQQCPNGLTYAGCTPAHTAFQSAGGLQLTTSDQPMATGGGIYAAGSPPGFPGGQLYGWGVSRMLPRPVGGSYEDRYVMNVNTSLYAGTPSITTPITNRSCARVIEFHNIGHPTHTVCSPNIPLYYLRTVTPIIDTNKNNVAAGGNPHNPVPCSATGHPVDDPRIKTNNPPLPSPATGARYLVSTAGGRVGLGSVAGANITGYNTYCYPDLRENIESYIAANGGLAGPNRKGNGEVNIQPSGFILDASYGLINTRHTLYVTGDLYIRGNVQYDNSQLAASLGVIVHGNIYIDKDVTRLYGYYYASPTTGGSTISLTGSTGLINTCAYDATITLNKNARPGDGSPQYDSLECKKDLQVNGLLMGNTFRFNRTGNILRNSSSEAIESIGQLYILTPPGFSDLTNNKLAPKGLRDLLPRY